MIRVTVVVDGADGTVERSALVRAGADRVELMAAAEEAMSEVLDTLRPLGKQAREELARRAQHEKEVREMREVTHEEWLALPIKRSVAKQDSTGRTRFYEIPEVHGG